MTKKILLCLVMATSVCVVANAQFGKIKIDTKKLSDAAGNAVTAVTLSDGDVARLAQEYIDWMDEHNPNCASSDAPNWKGYSERLEKLTKSLTRYDGLKLEFKVYCVKEQNAFACANGSVRVLAGLMDMLTDEELLGVIGHEIGHVKNGDSKDAMKQAYMTMAAKGLVASTGSDAAKLTDSQFGQLGEALVNAQYSQKQESQADDYGYNFLKNNNYNPAAMASALRKIEALEGGSQSKVDQLFSSHPDSGKRAQRLEAKSQ